MRTRIATGVVVALLTGCAGGSRVSFPQPSSAAQAELARLFSSPVDEPRRVLRPDRSEIVRRVDARVLPAAIEVCQRTFNNPDNCPVALGNRTLTVYPNDARINAFVGRNYDVAILGGLVRESGNDDEIALVLAHEYSHALFGHVSRTVNNALWGELLAGAAGLALIGATADTITDSQIATIAHDGTALGREIGGTVFSKDMELEADHLALFILAEAGYEMGKAMQFFQRGIQIQAWRQSQGDRRTVGFFETHPSGQERLLQLLATKGMIEQGADRPLWKQK